MLLINYLKIACLLIVLRSFDFLCQFDNTAFRSLQASVFFNTNFAENFAVFSCGQCTSTYIGETYRHLSTRIVEHKGIAIRTGQTLLTRSLLRTSILVPGNLLSFAGTSILVIHFS